jgi:hypothetical protein
MEFDGGAVRGNVFTIMSFSESQLSSGAESEEHAHQSRFQLSDRTVGTFSVGMASLLL